MLHEPDIGCISLIPMQSPQSFLKVRETGDEARMHGEAANKMELTWKVREMHDFEIS